MGTFGKTEHDITSLFPVGKRFEYDRHRYEVIVSGKPKPSRGECKTDTYVKAVDETGAYREFKLSIKQTNAEFLENKMSIERAKEIFGNDAQEIIRKSIQPIKANFEKDYLIYINKYSRTDAKSIKLGWKFELLRNDRGKRSGKIILTRAQKLNVYAGIGLSDDKKNCKVNDIIISDSGVANMIVEVEPGEQNIDIILSRMIPIEDYVDKQDSDLCFACKALNYRIVPNKWDGDRPLAVYVDWKYNGRQLSGNIVIDSPLEHKGNEIAQRVRELLHAIGIDKDNFADIKRFVTAETRVYE